MPIISPNPAPYRQQHVFCHLSPSVTECAFPQLSHVTSRNVPLAFHKWTIGINWKQLRRGPEHTANTDHITDTSSQHRAFYDIDCWAQSKLRPNVPRPASALWTIASQSDRPQAVCEGDFWRNENMAQRMFRAGTWGTWRTKGRGTVYTFRFLQIRVQAQRFWINVYIHKRRNIIIHIGPNVTICESMSGNNNEEGGIVEL